MRWMLRRGMEVVAERRSKLVLGQVREVNPDQFTVSVEVPGVAHGGLRELPIVAIPTWMPGKPHVRRGDTVLVAVPSAGAKLAHLVCVVSETAPALLEVANQSSDKVSGLP